MPTIQVESQVSLDALLNGVEQLNTTDLENFANEVLAIRAKRHAPSLPQREGELLQKINQSMSQIEWMRYRELIAKRQAETLTPEEQTALIALSDQIEAANSERIQFVAKLAQLRGTTIRSILEEPGLKQVSYA